ncbi:hypothetical protein EV356DRAFT_522811 [Viridothelium virens]|uniref:Peroxin 26 n=1 Tax=Viridothelium virens TaxID=1048519 RepID=A0A6A6HC51_VIRVR|nr:hypothetical protein EV356DRAFT_522811 [Viridothelium virens]
MTIPYEDPVSNSRMLASSTGSLSSRHQSSQIAKTYRQAAQLFLTRRLPEALSTIEPVITPSSLPEQRNGLENGDYPTLAPVATASRNTRIKVWSFYLTLLNSIIELGLEDGKHSFGSTKWRALVAKAREGTVWEDVVRDGYSGREGDVDAEVVSNLATLLLTHSPTQSLNQSRLETYLSASANPTLDISSSHFSPSHEYSTSQTPTPRRPSPARSNTGTSTPRDLHVRLKVLELYTLHVLPRNGEWDYARDFISMSALLDEERKDAFLQALQQLKEEMDQDAQREAELQRERDQEMEARRQEEERRKRQAEEDARRVQEIRNGHARSGSGSGTTSRGSGSRGGGGEPHTNGKARPGNQNGASRGPQSKQPAKKSNSQPSPSSIVKRASSLFLALQTSLAETARNMTGHPMLMLRFLLFLIAFLGIVGRREVRERLKRALAQSWEKVRRTVGMGVKVSYI